MKVNIETPNSYNDAAPNSWWYFRGGGGITVARYVVVRGNSPKPDQHALVIVASTDGLHAGSTGMPWAGYFLPDKRQAFEGVDWEPYTGTITLTVP